MKESELYKLTRHERFDNISADTDVTYKLWYYAPRLIRKGRKWEPAIRYIGPDMSPRQIQGDLTWAKKIAAHYGIVVPPPNTEKQ